MVSCISCHFWMPGPLMISVTFWQDLDGLPAHCLESTYNRPESTLQSLRVNDFSRPESLTELRAGGRTRMFRTVYSPTYQLRLSTVFASCKITTFSYSSCQVISLLSFQPHPSIFLYKKPSWETLDPPCSHRGWTQILHTPRSLSTQHFPDLSVTDIRNLVILTLVNLGAHLCCHQFDIKPYWYI